MNLTALIIIAVVVFAGSLFILFFPKIKAFFIKTFKSNKKKSKKKKKKESDKVKASKVVEQIRPILKPANEEKEKNEMKQLESQKSGKKEEQNKLPASEQKAIDFKYSSSAPKKSSLLDDLDEFDSKNFAPKGHVSNPTNFSGATVSPGALSVPMQNGINFNKPATTPAKSTSVPLNRDIKKEFEDIRKFLDLPENQNGGSLQKKYEEHKATQNNSKKIDASLFNEPTSHYADYRTNTNLNPLYRAPANDNVMRTNTKYSKPVPYASPLNTSSKNLNYKIDRTPVDVNALRKNLNHDRDDYLNFEEENIDLNKLSPKLKRMIISNILKRKNWD